MQQFINRLNELLADFHLDYHSATTSSLLEILYLVYVENSGVDNDEVRENFSNLYAALKNKSMREIDDIIDIVCDLCCAHERNGFLEGVKVGVKLAQEVDMR